MRHNYLPGFASFIFKKSNVVLFAKSPHNYFFDLFYCCKKARNREKKKCRFYFYGYCFGWFRSPISFAWTQPNGHWAQRKTRKISNESNIYSILFVLDKQKVRIFFFVQVFKCVLWFRFGFDLQFQIEFFLFSFAFNRRIYETTTIKILFFEFSVVGAIIKNLYTKFDDKFQFVVLQSFFMYSVESLVEL